MANVVHTPLEFFPRPTPFGFSFGLTSPSTWPTSNVTPGHTSPATFHHLASSINQQSPTRSQKRRLEPEDDEADLKTRDQPMDRSPTPERPKRAAPKRARVLPPPHGSAKDETKKENKDPSSDDNDVDVGVLLASLPPQSLLPLLTSLLSVHPELKASIIPLLPRPTLDTALQALAQSAKKLRDAYPYSSTPALPFSSPTVGTSFGFGSGLGSGRSSAFGAFGRPPPSFSSHQSSGTGHTGGMRDSYILSRLRPHIHDFVSACMSYMPYFSYVPVATSAPSNSPSSSNDGAPAQPHSTAIQALYKDKSHPSETFAFLSALTTHVLTQPPLTQTSLGPLIFPRLLDEWKAWVDRVDHVVNSEGGMFGSETVGSWARGLDEFAEGKELEGHRAMKVVRDRWVSKVGWLVGRMAHHPMEEES